MNRIAALFLTGITSLIALGSTADTASDLELVKDRTLNLLTLGDGKGPHRMKVVQSNDDWCEEFLSGEINQLVPGDWELPQINYKVVGQAQNWRRVAVAYQTMGSRYYHDKNLLKPLFAGLSNILDYFNPDTPRPENWHPWLIVIPQNLGELGLLMENELPAELLERLEISLADELQEMRLNGANAAWEARNHAYLALLQKDSDRLSRSARQVFRPVRYTYGSGVREDFSHLFHGHIPYAGGYGSGFSQTVSQFLVLFDQTQWAPVKEKADLIANFLLEHALWYVHEGIHDPHIVGRAYERINNAKRLTESTLFMTQVESPRQQELQAAAIELIQNGAPVSGYVAHLADQLPGDLAPRTLSGFRYWYCAEMGAYKGNGFHIGFRQYSNRVQDYEFLTLMGGEGWHLAYGFTYITRDGREWYPEGLHPGVDMYYLPATTTRLGSQPVNSKTALGIGDIGSSLNFGTSAFSGAAGFEDGGVSGFILIPAYGNFIANKSLHFFPEGYWAIGSGIRSTESSDNTGSIITPIIQWPVSENTPIILSADRSLVASEISHLRTQAKWLFADKIGACFQKDTEIYLDYQDGVLKVWLDHGIHPVNADYAYALLPNISIEGLTEFSRELPARPVVTGNGRHAVVDHRRNATSVVFFKAGSFDDMEVDHPAIIYRILSEEGSVYSLQNPLHTKAGISLRCTAPGKLVIPDPEVALSSSVDGMKRLHLDTNIGRIYRFGSGSIGQKVASVPRIDMEEMHDFSVTAVNSPEETILHMTIPSEALKDEYELTLCGHKGHLLKTFTDADIIDQEGQMITYRWDRAPADPDSIGIVKQRSGDFRLYLRTELKSSIDYITIPAYGVDGKVDLSVELPLDNNFN